MEFKPRKWLKRLTRQASALKKPAPDYIRAIHQWYHDKLWVFDVTGTAKVEKMLETFIYARKRYGVTTFVIDNLQKCGIAMSDDDVVKDFIDRLTDIAKEYDCTIFIVHHMRKGADESNQGKMGIKGSGAISDMTDTIIIWWRNKKKEASRAKAASNNEEFDETESPDCFMFCEGQRNGESEPTIGLWFDPTSNQYVEHYGKKPTQYVEFDKSNVSKNIVDFAQY
jgi:twinkle protein